MINDQKNTLQELKTRLAVLEADPHSDPREKIDVMNKLARSSLNHDLVESEQLSQQAHQLATNLDPAYQTGILDSLVNLGYVNYFLGNYNLALQNSLKALDKADALQMLDRHSAILHNLGSIYYGLGDYLTALQYYHRRYQVAQQTNNFLEEAEALNALGLVYDTIKAHERALEFYQQSYELYEAKNNATGIIMVLTNRALAHINLQNYPAALEEGLIAIDWGRSEYDDRGLINSLGVTGVAYFEMGDYTQALHYFQQALSKARAFGIKMLEATALKEIGKVYHRQSALDPALQHLQQALKIATEINAKSEMFECHRMLSEIHEQQSDLQKALCHHKLYHQIEKQVFNAEADKKIKNLQIVYDTEKAKREAELTRQKNAELEKEVIERRRAESVAKQRWQELLMLIEIGRDISSTLDLSTVLERIAARAKYLLEADTIAIFLRQSDQNTFRPTFVLGHEAEAVRAWTVTLGQGIAGHIAQTGVSEVINDTGQDPRAVHIPNTAESSARSKSMLCASLMIQEDVIGLVILWRNSQTELFTEYDLSFVVGLSQQAAIAIENARLVEELRHYATDLKAQNAELEAFAHTAAHDLKGPLGPIVGYAHVLEAYHPTLPEEEVRNQLRVIAESGTKMGNIIDELLLLASVREVQQVGIHALDMAHLVTETQKRLAHLIEEHQAEIILPAAGAWPLAQGYGPWIEEVWTNYLSNAIKYGGEPPRVEMGFDEPAPSQPHANPQIRFWVRDNGAGLTSEEQARLFTPFEQLHQVRAQGHGLGLSIVRRIMERLGGHVGVESQVGQGSRFWFTLPAYEGKVDALDEEQKE